MRANRTVATMVLGILALAYPLAAQNKTRAGAGPKAAVPAASAPKQEGKVIGAKRLEAHPAERTLQRLAGMSPEERQRALANFPPERRRMLMKRLENFQAMPPAAKERATSELEQLHSLPPQRQNQVRRSLRQLQALPDERKATVGAELERLNALPGDERRARMNSEEFRNRYSPAEQQMMSNLAEVFPQE